MNIGENIRRMRKEKGMTLQQLADILECSQQNISQYENGKRIPKIETIKKIADALGCKFECIYGEDTFIQEEDRAKVLRIIYEEELNDANRELSKIEKKLEDIMLCLYRTLNTKGRNKALDLVSMLAKLPEYCQNYDKGNPESPHPDAPESSHCESTKISPDKKGE